jgi:hypothetical protein
MDLIIFVDGMYQLVPVTQDLIGSISLVNEFNFIDLCDVLRLHLTEYHDYPINEHHMKDGSGLFYGCIMR